MAAVLDPLPARTSSSLGFLQAPAVIAGSAEDVVYLVFYVPGTQPFHDFIDPVGLALERPGDEVLIGSAQRRRPASLPSPGRLAVRGIVSVGLQVGRKQTLVVMGVRGAGY